MALGEPVYHFLTWEDHTSVLIVLGLNTACYLFFIAMAKVTSVVKQETIDASQAARTPSKTPSKVKAKAKTR